MKPKLYIVEDDEAVRISLQTVLEIYGYSVASFAAGEAFMDYVDTDPNAVVILDVNLPGASGLDILRSLRDRGNQMAAIIMSGRADSDMRATAKCLGASAFFEKPIVLDELLAIICSLDGVGTASRCAANPP